MNIKRIKELRERIGITQQDIADILKIQNTTYCNYENEKETIPIKHLITLSKYFNVSIDYLFGLTDIKQYQSTNLKIEKNNRLKEFRKENKLTQEKLANILNTSRSVIADYERGRYLIATPFLYTICKKYNISADYLLGLTDNPQYIK